MISTPSAFTQTPEVTINLSEYKKMIIDTEVVGLRAELNAQITKYQQMYNDYYKRCNELNNEKWNRDAEANTVKYNEKMAADLRRYERNWFVKLFLKKK